MAKPGICCNSSCGENNLWELMCLPRELTPLGRRCEHAVGRPEGFIGFCNWNCAIFACKPAGRLFTLAIGGKRKRLIYLRRPYWMCLCLNKAHEVIEIRAKFSLLVQAILFVAATDSNSQVFGFINSYELEEESSNVQRKLATIL